jgi:hypothetical protein
MSAPLRKENQESLPADNMDLAAQGEATDAVEDKTQARPRLVPSSAADSLQPGVGRSSTVDLTSPTRAEANRAEAEETGRAAKVEINARAAEPTHLFPGNEAQNLKQQWDQIQTRFVDQPRDAVHDADALVSSAIERLSQVFADERSRLEQQWSRGENISTEDLRVAFQRYRSFFQRMLSV